MHQRVDIRRRQVRISVNAGITPTLVITHKDDDVGMLIGVDVNNGQASEKQAEHADELETAMIGHVCCSPLEFVVFDFCNQRWPDAAK